MLFTWARRPLPKARFSFAPTTVGLWRPQDRHWEEKNSAQYSYSGARKKYTCNSLFLPQRLSMKPDRGGVISLTAFSWRWIVVITCVMVQDFTTHELHRRDLYTCWTGQAGLLQLKWTFLLPAAFCTHLQMGGTLLGGSGDSTLALYTWPSWDNNKNILLAFSLLQLWFRPLRDRIWLLFLTHAQHSRCG